MVETFHQTEGMTEPVVALINFMENFQKGEMVFIIPGSRFPSIPPEVILIVLLPTNACC